MLRSSLLWLSERQSIFNFVRRNRLARSFARRFVAGETVDEVMPQVEELHRRGMTTTLDLLGESVKDFADVDLAHQTYLAILRAQHAAGLETNASLKPSQFGLDLDAERCEQHIREIVALAREYGGFIRLDMESSDYTDRTLALHRRLAGEFGPHVGVVIQSCLRRSAADVGSLVASSTRVRLCKGAYREPAAVAFPDKRDVDAEYCRLMERLLVSGTYHGLATHDVAMIDHAKAFVAREGIPRDAFEFQMLYGVRRDLQEQLVDDGWRVRVYIPFGTHWYPYLMRRLAERPANITFILGNVVREAMRRS